MTALAIARVELVRLFRDRSNIFFVLVLPLLLVILIGAAFGGGVGTRIGAVTPVGDAAADGLVAAIGAADGVEIVAVDSETELVDGVSRGHLTAGVLVPDGFGAAVEAGEEATVGYVGRADTTAASVRAIVEAAVAERAATVTAARLAHDVTGRPVDELVDLAGGLQAGLPGVAVVTEEVGGDEVAGEFAGLGRFDLGASSQLFLFVFLTALTSGTALIQTRQYGVARRMLSTATPARTILLGQAGGRFAVALFQAGYIVVATALLFGVNWGDPVATGTIVLLFCAASAGAGMLLGSLLDNDSQAGGVGVGLGLVLAALGGSMMALEFFPEGMRRVARVTPHAWANEAMAEIVRRDGGVLDVLAQVGALAAFAVVLLGAATLALRRALTR